MESVNNEKVVVFRTYNTLFEANVVKELLASNDIPSMIKNEHTTVLLPMFSPMSGVALMVLEKDLAKAREIADGTNNSDNGLIEK
ncbi:MAG: DUF2007 domain-containing protein [Bacteroidales bacterium]|nr:DUF2007 domain-containing protein [Bacteroidales bacterium]